MPTVIVEDGSNVSNANSFVSVVTLNNYAADRGLAIPATTTDKEIALILAAEYLEVRRAEYQGEKTNEDQTMQWPRSGVLIDGIELADDAIPAELVKAQCQLVAEIHRGTPLYPRPRTTAGEGFVTEKTVGPLTKRFNGVGAGSISSTKPIRIAAVESILRPLMGCSSLKTVRV
jgi:hypothetical protein